MLLVDDEKSISDFASKALQRFGYTVLTAASGEEALDIFTGRKNQIDLVLLDIGMPGMGGHQCLRELIQIDPSLKVVIASGYSVNGRLKETLDSGAAAYIGKPYRIMDLLKSIRKVLDESGATRLFHPPEI